MRSHWATWPLLSRRAIWRPYWRKAQCPVIAKKKAQTTQKVDVSCGRCVCSACAEEHRRRRTGQERNSRRLGHGSVSSLLHGFRVCSRIGVDRAVLLSSLMLRRSDAGSSAKLSVRLDGSYRLRGANHRRPCPQKLHTGVVVPGGASRVHPRTLNQATSRRRTCTLHVLCGLPEGRSVMSQLRKPSVDITMANAARAPNITRHRDQSTRPNSSTLQEVRL
jgi:hypothetical protein